MADKPGPNDRNRRSVLKGIAALSGTSIVSSQAAFARRSRRSHRGKTSDIITLKGDIDNSISPKQIEEEVKARFSHKSEEIAAPIPNNTDQYSIVAYGFGTDSSGVGKYVFGTVPNPGAASPKHTAPNTGAVSAQQAGSNAGSLTQRIEKEHAKLDEFEQSINNNGRLDTTESQVGAASAGGVPSPLYGNLTQMTTGFSRSGWCPYGEVVISTAVYKDKRNPVDIGHKNVYLFGIANTVSFYPGTNQCGSYYGIEEFTMKHRWNEYYNGATVRDHQPDGRKDGEITGVSASVGYGSAGIGFSFSQPDVSRSDFSSTGMMDIKYTWNDNYGWSSTSRFASIASFDSKPDSGYRFVDTAGSAGFFFPYSDSYSIPHYSSYLHS